ncbi:MAG: hypothetical protein GXO06_00485 [Epsilonproteobacteria bacterium]|nr:hypothetical protein [Campylobacterota bacterium]
MKIALILTSTPLQLFGAVTTALSDRDTKYHLIYIEQIGSRYHLPLRDWRDNPFESIDIALIDKSSIWAKIKSKRVAIEKIFKLVEKIEPHKLIVGNDRKTEVSATIHRFKSILKIEYLDDGIHSYILERSSIFKYTHLDSFIKWLLYGYRVNTPKYIGCSEYIDGAYLFKPEFANSCIRRKEVKKLDIEILKSDRVRGLIDISDNLTLKDIDIVLILPHRKELNSRILNILIKKFDNPKVAIKPHPRDNESTKIFKRAQKISYIPMEVLTLLIDNSVKIVGFATTALLTAKWLNGDLDIVSLNFRGSDSRVVELMERSGIRLEEGESF